MTKSTVIRSRCGHIARRRRSPLGGAILARLELVRRGERVGPGTPSNRRPTPWNQFSTELKKLDSRSHELASQKVALLPVSSFTQADFVRDFMPCTAGFHDDTNLYSLASAGHSCPVNRIEIVCCFFLLFFEGNMSANPQVK